MDCRVKPGCVETRGAPKLRRRLFARLIDRDVLAMRQRGAAVGDHQRIEFDEAMALGRTRARKGWLQRTTAPRQG